MEFPRDESFDFAQSRGMDVCEAIDLSVNRGAVRAGAQGRSLANMECECEHELVIVAQLENEIRRARYRLGILQIASRSQFLGISGRWRRKHRRLELSWTDLYEFNRSAVPI